MTKPRVPLSRERVKLIDPDVPPQQGFAVDIKPVPVQPPPADPRNSAYHVPTEYTRRQVELLVAYGLPHDAIAHVIGVKSVTTLSAHYADEIKHGKERVNARAAHRLFHMMEQNEDMRVSLTATIFWLKTRAGWRESTAVVHSGTVNHEHEHRAVTHEERAIRTIQLLNAARTGGVGSAVVERLRALVAPAGTTDASGEQ